MTTGADCDGRLQWRRADRELPRALQRRAASAPWAWSGSMSARLSPKPTPSVRAARVVPSLSACDCQLLVLHYSHASWRLALFSDVLCRQASRDGGIRVRSRRRQPEPQRHNLRPRRDVRCDFQGAAPPPAARPQFRRRRAARGEAGSTACSFLPPDHLSFHCARDSQEVIASANTLGVLAGAEFWAWAGAGRPDRYEVGICRPITSSQPTCDRSRSHSSLHSPCCAGRPGGPRGHLRGPLSGLRLLQRQAYKVERLLCLGGCAAGRLPHEKLVVRRQSPARQILRSPGVSPLSMAMERGGLSHMVELFASCVRPSVVAQEPAGGDGRRRPEQLDR